MTGCKSLTSLIFSSLIIVSTVFECASGFSIRQVMLHSSIASNGGMALLAKNGDDESQEQQLNEAAEEKVDDDSKGAFNWVEEWAMEGKEAAALMKTQERTQRVMLAQMTEDRIFEITKVLDTLVDETTGDIAEADMPKAKELAMQTRNLQKEYKDLVTGAPSTLLETLVNLNLSEDEDDD